MTDRTPAAGAPMPCAPLALPQRLSSRGRPVQVRHLIAARPIQIGPDRVRPGYAWIG